MANLMTATINRQISKADYRFLRPLIILIWSNNTLLGYFKAVLMRLPLLGDFANAIIVLLFVLAIIYAFPYLLNRIKPRDLLLVFGLVTVYIVSYLFYPGNSKYLDEYAWPFIGCTLPYIFIGLSINYEKSEKDLRIISILAIVLGLVYSLFISNPADELTQEYESQDAAYFTLPHILLITFIALRDKKIIDISVVLIGVFSLLGTGNRGSLACFAFFILCYILFLSRIKHRFVVFSSLGLLAAVFIIYFEKIFLFIADLLSRVGFSGRIIRLVAEGEMLNESGRDNVRQILINAIKDGPLFGYGITGDNTLVGMYSHNILIEFMISFGMFLGGLLFIVVIVLFIRAYIKAYSKEAAAFLLLLVSIGFVKLFISNTFLIEPFFFFLIGYSMQLVRSKNRYLSDNNLPYVAS